MQFKVRKMRSMVAAACVGVALCAGAARAADEAAPKDGWEVNDMKRPQPRAVTPGSFSTNEKPGDAPSDATVLFGGNQEDLGKWKKDKPERKEGEAPKPEDDVEKPAGWKVENGDLVCVPRSGTIVSKDEFRDVQLHAEFWHPADIQGTSQGRGNSGIFFMGLYELQVLDNYKADTYPDGMVGGMYGQYPPLVNAAKPPGNWQVYDVIFRAPVYEGERVVKPAHMTVFLNGVAVQDDAELLGPTKHSELTKYPKTHPEKGPIKLQDHGHPVHFRNIWVRPLGDPPVAAARSSAGFLKKMAEKAAEKK
jgi:hypothetical protein